MRLSDTILLMEADPGRIVKRFPIDKSLEGRDDGWVYKMTAELMQAAEVRESFGLV